MVSQSLAELLEVRHSYPFSVWVLQESPATVDASASWQLPFLDFWLFFLYFVHLANMKPLSGGLFTIICGGFVGSQIRLFVMLLEWATYQEHRPNAPTAPHLHIQNTPQEVDDAPKTNIWVKRMEEEPIRRWGCHRTEAPFIFIHIGKSGM